MTLHLHSTHDDLIALMKDTINQNNVHCCAETFYNLNLQYSTLKQKHSVIKKLNSTIISTNIFIINFISTCNHNY